MQTYIYNLLAEIYQADHPDMTLLELGFTDNGPLLFHF
jgi:hypothetical protein